MVPRVGQRNDEQALNRSYTVASGSRHLVQADQASAPIADAPLPAP
jgi:hypothetical protein